MNVDTGFGDAGSMFGTSQDTEVTTSGSGSGAKAATKKQKLVFDAANLESIVSEVLSQTKAAGVAFGGAKTSDIFSADAMASASGAFASKLAGELAKISGEEVTAGKETSTSVSGSSSDTATKKASFKDQLFDAIGVDFDQFDILHALDLNPSEAAVTLFSSGAIDGKK